MKAEWTEPSEEVNRFIIEGKYAKMMTEYFISTKRWSFYKEEKDKEPIAVFEQEFDMNYFK